MKKSSSILLITQLFLLNLAPAQQIKTYKGDYKEGKSTYQYYEDKNYERVYDGNFSYTRYSGESTINGTYEHNIKTGKWVFTDVDESFLGLTDHTYENLTVNYKNGELNGICSYVKKDLDKNKKIIAKSTASFTNGNFSGKYYLWTIESETKFNVNKEGFIDGDFIKTYKNYEGNFEDKRKYKNGILYWQLHRNLETGKIIEKIDIEETVLNYLVTYDSTYGFSIAKEITINRKDVEYEHRTYGEEINYNHFIFKNTPIIAIIDSTNTIDKLWSKMPGGFLYFTDVDLMKGANYPNPYITKKLIIPKGLNLAEMANLSAYKSYIYTADSLLANNLLQKAKDNYINAINLLSSEFVTYPLEKVEIINDKLYTQLIAEADSLYQFKNYELALTSYESANTIAPTEYCNTQILAVRKIITQAKFDNLIAEADVSFTQNDFKLALSKYNSAYELIQNEYVLTQINKTKSKLSIIKADSLLQLEEIELALKAYKRSNKDFETGYAQQQIKVCNDIIAFNNSDYGKIKRDVKLELTKWLVKAKYESEKDYEARVKKNIDTQLQSIIQQKVKFYKFKFDKQLNKMFTGQIKNYESKSETLKIGAYVNSLNLQMSTALANRIIDGLSGYKVHGCGKYGCIKVVFNDILLVDNNYTLSNATVLFFLNGREYDLYQDIFDGGFKISSTKKGLKIRPNWTKKDIKFNNIEESKTNGIFLYYDWKLATQTNFDATKIQEIDITLENLDIELPF